MRPAVFALAAFIAAPAEAQAPCRLALALAFDVSRSVDAADYAIQTEGIRAALTDPEIVAALLGPVHPVALAVYEWSGPRQQTLAVPWTVVRGVGDLDAVLVRLAAHRRDPVPGTTALGEALAYGRTLIDRAPDCAGRVLDVSGDGQNNAGPDPRTVYGRADWDGITVNGLAIGGHESDIAAYCAAEVIRGPGAFVEVARTHRDFPPAFRRKLLRELTEPVFGALSP